MAVEVKYNALSNCLLGSDCYLPLGMCGHTAGRRGERVGTKRVGMENGEEVHL